MLELHSNGTFVGCEVVFAIFSRSQMAEIVDALKNLKLEGAVQLHMFDLWREMVFSLVFLFPNPDLSVICVSFWSPGRKDLKSRPTCRGATSPVKPAGVPRTKWP